MAEQLDDEKRELDGLVRADELLKFTNMPNIVSAKVGETAVRWGVLQSWVDERRTSAGVMISYYITNCTFSTKKLDTAEKSTERTLVLKAVADLNMKYVAEGKPTPTTLTPKRFQTIVAFDLAMLAYKNSAVWTSPLEHNPLPGWCRIPTLSCLISIEDSELFHIVLAITAQETYIRAEGETRAKVSRMVLAARACLTGWERSNIEAGKRARMTAVIRKSIDFMKPETMELCRWGRHVRSSRALSGVQGAEAAGVDFGALVNAFDTPPARQLAARR